MAGRLREHPSPNFGPRPDGVRIDMLILHYTGMASAAAALARLCDPAAAVSAHYLIDEEGTVFRLVPEAARAWHAGRAFWAGERDVNGRSIGIELVNPGHELGYRPFPEPQMAALEALAADILARHPIPPERVLGHADVAPTRRRDPGELFDWARLARAGIGLWPAAEGPPAEAAGGAAAPEAMGGLIREAQARLAAFGYEIAPSGRLAAHDRAVLAAFQRHFRPARVDGRLDGETLALIRRLPAPAGPAA